jgi:predicted small secreted protein
MFPNIKFFTLVVLGGAAMTVSLTGCETMDGAGRDIENAGEAVQSAAE